MSRPRHTVQDPAQPTTPRTPTARVIGTRQSARSGADSFKVTTPQAPRAPTVPPVLYEPTSPSPMPMTRLRRENHLASHAQASVRHTLGSTPPHHQSAVPGQSNGVKLHERQEADSEDQEALQPHTPGANGRSQASLIVSIPLTPTKRPRDRDISRVSESQRKLRRSSQGAGSHPRQDALPAMESPSQDQVEELLMDTDPAAVDNQEDSSMRLGRDKRKQPPHIDARIPQGSGRPTRARAVMPWQSTEKDQDAEGRTQQHRHQTADKTAGESSTQPQQHQDPYNGNRADEPTPQENKDIRPPSSAEVVRNHMLDFEQGFQGLQGRFKLLGKIGEGTFSTVYKAVDLEYDKYDNSGWDYADDQIPPTNKQDPKEQATRQDDAAADIPVPAAIQDGKVVAIKRIYVTSSPQRIENEIAILRDLSGHKNVVPLITASRFRDQVIVVLPYFEHSDFRLYYRDLPMDDIRCYFRALLNGLAHIHAKGIIHRDIKPSNFLYNTTTKTGVVVDFGLAERQDGWPRAHGSISSRQSSKSSRSAQPPLRDSQGLVTLTKKSSLPPNPKSTPNIPAASISSSISNLKNTMATMRSTAHQGLGTRAPVATSQYGTPRPGTPANAVTHGLPALAASQMPSLVNHVRPKTTGAVPHPALPSSLAAPGPSAREPGFFRKDLRPVIRVNRAGTPGFRAPEILFRHVRQTVALDIWCVGVILLSFLTGRFPFFNSRDDVEGILEIAILFGSIEMKRAAAAFDRNFATTVPSIKELPISLLRVCQLLHPKRFTPPDGYISKSAAARQAAREQFELRQQLANASGSRTGSQLNPPTANQGSSKSESTTPAQPTINNNVTKESLLQQSRRELEQRGSISTAVAPVLGAPVPDSTHAGGPESTNIPLQQLLAEHEKDLEETGSTLHTGAEQGDSNAGINTSSSSSSNEPKRKPAAPTVVGTDSQEDLEEVVNLLGRLLELDPRKRITAEQALKHPFLAERAP
ncbi:hypothetical protein BGZ98_004538 [Dissophora globulifera]|nr:hypothetical protein BGZ98_004538 [Dissophora globulifera]